MITQFIHSVLDYFGSIGYVDIFVLMTIESSIIPFPSEVVMIPAGISAQSGNINPIIATLLWGAWSLLGALLNYYIVGKYLGKPFLWKYGKYFFIKHHDYERAEKLFLENANLYTFVGRFIPVVRQLISVPAGIFGMKLIPFSILTTLGASIWCGILVALGWYFGEPIIDLVKLYSHEFQVFGIPLILVYIWWNIWGGKKNKK